MMRNAIRVGLLTPVLSMALIVQSATGGSVSGQSGWVDDLTSFDSSLWSKADGRSNGNPFDVGWRADHVGFAGSQMTVTLDDQPCPGGCSGEPFASGEYRTNQSYGFGRFEVSMKAASGEGVVSSFFTYTGPYESPPTPWDEIDIEILGKDTTRMQVNYVTNGVGGHETTIDLGFDAAAGFHTYAFEWSATEIAWYVDGALVHVEDGSRGPLPTTPGKVMMNLWTGAQVSGWLGDFNYTAPVLASYDYVSYQPGEAAGSSLHVEANDVSVGQQGKRYRATASVMIVDAAGSTVAGARVEGAWSEGRRVRTLSGITDANGRVSFDSRNSSSDGPFEFCVSNVSLQGWTYVPAANAATCGEATFK